MFARIQVSLDTTEFAQLALPIAIELARRSQGSLDLVGVHEPVAGLETAEWNSAALTWLEEDLARIAAEVATESGRPVDMHVEHGPVVPALLARAKESGADLLVTATHGRGVISRAWLGSIADGLIRHSHVPLLLIRPDEEGQSPSSEFDRILVPLDGSELSFAVLPLARMMAREFKARMHLVRVVMIPGAVASPYAPSAVLATPDLVADCVAAAEEKIGKEAAALRSEGLEVTTAVLTGTAPAAVICEEAKRWGAKLLVMSTHGRAGLTRAFLGSTADKVVRSTQVPVMVSNPGDMV